MYCTLLKIRIQGMCIVCMCYPQSIGRNETCATSYFEVQYYMDIDSIVFVVVVVVEFIILIGKALQTLPSCLYMRDWHTVLRLLLVSEIHT